MRKRAIGGTDEGAVALRRPALAGHVLLDVGRPVVEVWDPHVLLLGNHQGLSQNFLFVLVGFTGSAIQGLVLGN